MVSKLIFAENIQEVPQPNEVETNSRDFVLYGNDNLFPQFIVDTINDCSLIQAITDTITKYVFGNGIDTQLKTSIINDKGQTLEDVVKFCINDYVQLGAFAVQVLRNKLGDILKLNPLNVERVRLNESADKVFYSSKWTKYSTKSITYPIFNGLKEQTNSVYYFKRPTSKTLYGRASWFSSLKDVLVLNEITTFNLSSIQNNFTPSAMVTFCSGIPTEDEQKEVERKIKEKFTGAKNASKLIVSFADNKETAPVVEKLAYENFAERMVTIQETARDNVFTAFQINPILLGLKTTDGIFSSDQYQEVFDLYNSTIIKNIQKEIENSFAKMEFAFKFIPFTVEWSKKQDEQNNVVE